MAYSSHLTEQIRVDIGRMLITHEMIKIFPGLDYDEIKRQVGNRWSNLDETVAIRNFWNLVNSLMMGYELKNIVREITSQQYVWSLTTGQAIANLEFTIDINGLQSNTKTAGEMKVYFEENPEERERVVNSTNMEFPEGDVRHLDPLVVLEQRDLLFVHDGNGRLLKAVIENLETIDSYIGTQNDVPKPNHWVSTSYLMKLTEAKARGLLITILRESDNAVFEFENGVLDENSFKREVLKEIKT